MTGLILKDLLNLKKQLKIYIIFDRAIDFSHV